MIVQEKSQEYITAYKKKKKKQYTGTPKATFTKAVVREKINGKVKITE